MKLLLKQVIVADTNSPHNGQQKDILIDKGFITKISDKIDDSDAKIIEHPNMHASPGWVDTFSHFCDPGFEYKETLESGANAAAAGGYTTVFTLPNTLPVVYSKTQVEYIVQKSRSLPVRLMPLGAITKNGEGKELAEMYDMLNSGAVAFSDGLNPVQTAGLLLKALQYVKAFDGVLVQVPIDKSIGQFGLMNEGIMSTRLGLPGVPEIAEELLVARDLELAKYANSKLHITAVSTAKSIDLISKAKAAGIKVTCSVTPYHLFFNDEDLHDYDTNLKVDPPLRSKLDMLALRKAVEEGVVDCIASHHIPQDWDNKVCEFEYAKPGMIGLESCFMVLNTIFPSLKIEQVVRLLSGSARDIFKLSSSPIQAGSPVDITLFDRESTSEFSKENIKSKSVNSAFVGRQLKGRVIGIINQERLYLN
jgi:dihydroorotase